MINNADEVLISSSVLCTYWEHSRNDMLDLLMPFLKYAIASKVNEGDVIPVGEITEMFKSEFGYYDIPQDVILTLLKRLSPAVLKKEKNSYKLRVSLTREYEDYKKNYLIKKERQEKVCQVLAEYLEANIPGRTYNKDTALESLFAFFNVEVCLS